MLGLWGRLTGSNPVPISSHSHSKPSHLADMLAGLSISPSSSSNSLYSNNSAQTILSLPYDIQLLILKYLSVKDIHSYLASCRFLSSLTTDKVIHRTLIARYNGVRHPLLKAMVKAQPNLVVQLGHGLGYPSTYDICMKQLERCQRNMREEYFSQSASSSVNVSEKWRKRLPHIDQILEYSSILETLDEIEFFKKYEAALDFMVFKPVSGIVRCVHKKGFILELCSAPVNSPEFPIPPPAEEHQFPQQNPNANQMAQILPHLTFMDEDDILNQIENDEDVLGALIPNPIPFNHNQNAGPPNLNHLLDQNGAFNIPIFIPNQPPQPNMPLMAAGAALGPEGVPPQHPNHTHRHHRRPLRVLRRTIAETHFVDRLIGISDYFEKYIPTLRYYDLDFKFKGWFKGQCGCEWWRTPANRAVGVVDTQNVMPSSTIAESTAPVEDSSEPHIPSIRKAVAHSFFVHCDTTGNSVTLTDPTSNPMNGSSSDTITIPLTVAQSYSKVTLNVSLHLDMQEEAYYVKLGLSDLRRRNGLL